MAECIALRYILCIKEPISSGAFGVDGIRGAIAARVEWEDIRYMARTCITKCISKVGIPDLLIAQNSVQNRVLLFTADKHFHLMRQKKVSTLDLL